MVSAKVMIGGSLAEFTAETPDQLMELMVVWDCWHNADAFAEFSVGSDLIVIKPNLPWAKET
jgi:hypothetical protein